MSLSSLPTILAGVSGFLDRALSYVNRFRRFLLRVLALWLSAFVVFAALPLTRPQEFHDLSFTNWLNHSLSVYAFRWLETYLLPHGETLIANAPFDAFMAVMYIGAGLALLVVLPYLAYLGVRWLSPGLKPGERGMLRALGVFLVGFFLAGVGFGLLLLPSLYQFAYSTQLASGVTGTITLNGFIGTTVFFLLGLGVTFEIPTVAYGLALFGILSSQLLRKHMAFVGLIVCPVTALFISTGAGGGIVEIPVAILLFGLYVLSYFIVRRVENRRSAASFSIPLSV